MRIGIMFGRDDGAPGSLEDVVLQARDTEDRGFAAQWVPNIFGVDAITALAIAGRETSRIELGTAVVPTYPRHPTAIAQQALTASAATDGRFTLGIGLSHKLVIEDLFGLSYAKPARHMREYLEVLGPLLRGETAKYAGEEYRVNVGLQVPDAKPVPVVVAALGPTMLRIAGRLADGTITWMTGPRTLESHIVPTLGAAAREAGRPEPRVVASLPIALTGDREAARERCGKVFAVYGTLPSYRAMLDREGAAGPADVGMLGDEAELRAGLSRLRDMGVTDFNASIVPLEDGGVQRTKELLRDWS